jgi:small subunit ribosomal protein S6
MSKTVYQYEGMFLFPVGASADLDGTLTRVRSILEKHGAEILVLKKWDERRLAFEIKHQKRGVYIISFFKAAGEAVSAIEREVNLSDDVLRVMVLRADDITREEMEAVEPQPIQERQERTDFRSDRPDRGDRPARPRRDEEAAGAER